MLATQRSSASLCLLRPARSAVVRLRSTASTRPPPSPSPESPPSHLSCQPPPPPPPPPSFLDKKDELHELELLHQPTFPQTLPSLKAYHRIHDEEMHTHPIPSTPLYRYDVGYEARFDTLHPPILPPIDSAEVGSGDYDQRMEQSQLDPAQLPDPTNRVPHHALRFLEDVGYVTAVRASFMAFLSSLAPAADVLAQGSVEVDVGGLAEGVTRTVKWRGKPVFIRHRTAQDIAHAKRDDELVRQGLMRDPQLDEERVKREDFLVVVGICTHLGCVPLSDAGDYPPGGFFCPCHGSHYDSSARVRKGPAPLNLEVPPYDFVGPNKIQLGTA